VDPNRYTELGNIYYNVGNWSGTRKAWEKSLALKPDNPLVLNNLAWFYATCEDNQFRDPYRALALAKLAVSLDPAPHIWDTLAESYYVNGRYHDAVEAARQALSRATEKRSYYEGQLKKFEAVESQKKIGSQEAGKLEGWLVSLLLSNHPIYPYDRFLTCDNFHGLSGRLPESIKIPTDKNKYR